MCEIPLFVYFNSIIKLVCFPCSFVQEEKVQLKQKADADKAIKTRASISVDLVEEDKDDITHAKKVKYGTSASQDRRLKRLQIKSEPVLGPAHKVGGASISKRQQALLLGMGGGSGSGGAKFRGVKPQEARRSLGIRHKE